MAKRKRKLKGTKHGWIYLLNVGYDNLYKIGTSQLLNTRVKELSKAHPKLKIEMAYLVLNAISVEKHLHKKYEYANYKWELFELQPHNLRSIRKYLVSEYHKYRIIRCTPKPQGRKIATAIRTVTATETEGGRRGIKEAGHN